jgi:hypothetical protein
MIEVSSGGHPALPRKQLDRVRLITGEQSQPLKLGLQVVTRFEFPGGRERRTDYRKPRALA